jgi:NitT/TauT family transport system substrate-binding protein
MWKKLVAATLVAGVASGPAAAQKKFEVTQIVSTVSFAFLPLYVAEHMGYFAEEGVELKSINTATAQAGMAAVANGAAAYYLSTPAGGARSAAAGAKVINCGALMAQNPTNIVVSAEVAKKHNLTNVEQMPIGQRIALIKGLRMAAHTPGSSPDQTLRFLLRQAGMNPESDVQILPIVQTAILAAMEQKRIDGFAYSSPLAETSVARHGAKVLISMAKGEYQPLAGQLSISMVCSRDWVESQPDAAAATMRAIWRAMRLMRSEPAKARAAARKAFPNVEDAIFDMSFESNRLAFPDSPLITRAQMEAAIDFQNKMSGDPITIKVENTFTNAIVERAAKGLKQ